MYPRGARRGPHGRERWGRRAGAYEPRGWRVIAVEASEVMAGAHPSYRGAILAYPLPLADRSVDVYVSARYNREVRNHDERVLRYCGAQRERRGACWLAGLLAMVLASSLSTSATPAFGASSGIAFAWGAGAYGQLGDGSETSSDVPVPVSDLSEVAAVSGGYGFGLALLGDGTVAAWGENESGLLGDGSQTNSDVPVAVSGLSEVTAVAAGWYHSLALLSNGTVEAWGYDGFGELGDGSEGGFSDVPVFVKNLSGVSAVAAGPHSSMALLGDGKVEEWGYNEGDMPVVVNGVSEVTAISAGWYFSLALLKDGTVMAWGDNEDGRLGDGKTASSEVPVPVSGLSEVTAISAGSDHSLALLKNGTVMAWGENSAGQLGDGASSGPETCLNGFGEADACSMTPIPVGGLSGVAAVAAGSKSSLALLDNGSVMAWGENAQGQLGDRSTVDSDVPVPVAGLRGATAISAGSWYQGLSVADPSAPPATITKVAPACGPPAGGTRVTITGTNFNGATEVTFGSTDATSFKVESETSITAVSPPGTGAVDVGVGVSGVLSPTSRADQFSYAPVVTKVEPDRGPAVGGTAVTVTGTGFTGATQVKFGAANATSFKVESETEITAVSPAGAGTVDVTVTTPGGTSPARPSDDFDYGPTITGVTPEHGPPSGGAEVTITGTNFTGATAVRFGSNAATSFKVESDTKIVAVTPAFSGGGEDGVGVYVTTPGGTNNSEECGYPVGYRYEPTITKVEPSAGPAGGGTQVTIRGAAFEGTVAGGGFLCTLLEPVVKNVEFGSKEATDWHFDSDTEITAVAPPGAGTVDVTIDSVMGTSPIIPGDQFSYNPTVTNLEPSYGRPAGGTHVTITGANFNEVSAVKFGSADAASFKVESESKITAVAPAGTGTVEMTVTTAGGTSPTSPADDFDYRPSVTNVVPDYGPSTGGTHVTITGANFNEVSAVKFGSVEAPSFEVISEDEIKAVSPSGTGTLDVTIETLGGTSATSSVDQFSYDAPVTTGGDGQSGTSGTATVGGSSGGSGSPGALTGTVSNTFTLSDMESVARHGTVKVMLTLPGPGTLQIVGEAAPTQLADALHTKKKRMTTVIKRLRLTVGRAGRIVVTLAPTASAKAVLARLGKLSATVTITYTPKGGTPRSITRTVTFRLKRRRSVLLARVTARADKPPAQGSTIMLALAGA